MVFEFLVNGSSFRVRVRPRRSDTGLDDDESYDAAVEDELIPELDDNPETTTGTKFSVLHKVFFRCLVNLGRVWLLTAGPRMCVDALESTTNCRSLEDFYMGAGVALVSIG